MRTILKLFDRRWMLTTGLIAIATLLCFQNLTFYLSFDFHFYMALLAFPFVMYVKQKGVYSYRFGIMSLIFLALYPFLKIQVCYFLGFTFFILFIIETFFGKLNDLPVFLLVILSPLFIFFMELTGFPMRLKVTQAAASLLGLVLHKVTYSGNILYVNGHAFGVDRACSGLNMTITAFLIALGLMAFYEKKTRQQLPLLLSIGVLAATWVLIVCCNLIRIMVVVLLKAAPETMAHEAAGILSLVLCVIVPLYFLTRYCFKRFGKASTKIAPKSNSRNAHFLVILLIIQGLAFLNIHRDNFRNDKPDLPVQNAMLPGYNKQTLKNGVVKFTSGKTLVYIKPSRTFYGADHTPLICWQGSGYEFTKEELIRIGPYTTYFAELRSDEDILYTIWWYDNGKHKTTSQLDWRWRMFIGEQPFRVVNVTSASKEQLFIEAMKLLDQNLFQPKKQDDASENVIACAD